MAHYIAGSTDPASPSDDNRRIIHVDAAGDIQTDIATLPTQTTKWSALGSEQNAILGAGVAPTLKNLANNANKLGNAFDNSLAANRFRYADFELNCRGAAAFSSGGIVKLWLLGAPDGSTYEDGSDSVTPARPPDGIRRPGPSGSSRWVVAFVHRLSQRLRCPGAALRGANPAEPGDDSG
jgi:hypothetical protein